MANLPLQRFIQESWDGLSLMESRVRSLDGSTAPSDAAGPLRDINETLSRMQEASGFLGLPHLGRLTQAANKVVQAIQHGGLSASSGVVSRLNEAVTVIRHLLEDLEATGEERTVDQANLIAELDRLLSDGEHPETNRKGERADRLEAVPGPQIPIRNPFTGSVRVGQPPFRPRILVVEDSLYGRQWIAAVLESEGAHVVLADGPETAFSLLERMERFDLIIAGLDRPGTNLRFPQWLQERFELQDTPMVALLTESDSTQRSQSLGAGFARCVERFNRLQLLKEVRNLSRGRAERVRIPA